MSDEPTTNGHTEISDSGRWSKAFAGTPEQVRAARRWVDGLLDGCPVAADLLLVFAELANNALVHSASEDSVFTVSLELYPGCARVEVADQGGQLEPHVAGIDLDAPGGRGLLLVEHLTGGRWCFEGSVSGRTVWAELVWKSDSLT